MWDLSARNREMKTYQIRELKWTSSSPMPLCLLLCIPSQVSATSLYFYLCSNFLWLNIVSLLDLFFFFFKPYLSPLPASPSVSLTLVSLWASVVHHWNSSLVMTKIKQWFYIALFQPSGGATCVTQLPWWRQTCHRSVTANVDSWNPSSHLGFWDGGFQEIQLQGHSNWMHDFRLDTTDFPAQMDHYTSPYWTHCCLLE